MPFGSRGKGVEHHSFNFCWDFGMGVGDNNSHRPDGVLVQAKGGDFLAPLYASHYSPFTALSFAYGKPVAFSLFLIHISSASRLAKNGVLILT